MSKSDGAISLLQRRKDGLTRGLSGIGEDIEELQGRICVLQKEKEENLALIDDLNNAIAILRAEK